MAQGFDGLSRLTRDQHLFGPGPKRLLALDGGGIRGAISVAFLVEMERLLREEHPDARLGDWFDLVGGTSTGAIIAGALALGANTREIEEFYRERARRVFRRSLSRIPGLRSRFDAAALTAEIRRVTGERTLGSPDLVTGFALVAKRLDTGSPWIISNNPRAPYWQGDKAEGRIGNRDYRLSELIRASAAAPSYFDPEHISVHESQRAIPFIDGGMTPHNNPAFALFLMTRLKPYGLCWPTGPGNLTIVSVGTGSYPRGEAQGATPSSPIILAFDALNTMMENVQSQVLMLMQWLGESTIPININREVGTMPGDNLPGGPLFRFVRYDVRLAPDWLEENFSGRLSSREVASLRDIARAENIPLAYEIGREAARKQVKPEHFGLRPRT